MDLHALPTLPGIDLRHLQRLTDGTGILQHALYPVPDLNCGYSVDDEARALIAAILYSRLEGYDETRMPLARYMSFLLHAFNPATGRFRNFMRYDRTWCEEAGSEDSHGRSVWALGLTVALSPLEEIAQLAEELLVKALPALQPTTSPRTWAFAILGLEHYLQRAPADHAARALHDELAGRLYDQYCRYAEPDWPWFESIVTYDNAKLPHALLVAGRLMGDATMRDRALEALDWLFRIQTAEDGHLSIVGNCGWYVRGGRRAGFDQQPLEAHAMLEAALVAAEITGERRWIDRAWTCYEWFRGRNDSGLSLYNEETGGCHDGLQADRVNANQGAESLLAYLLSVLRLHAWSREASEAVSPGARPKALGVVGASSFASFCLEQWKDLPGLRPVSVWSRTPAHARSFARTHGLSVRDERGLLVRDDSVDLVHVATIPVDHAPAVLEALQAGRHVLCEKPLCLSTAEGATLLRASREHGKRLGVNFMMRYSPVWQPLRDLIERNLLGRVLRGYVVNCAGDDGLPPEHWFWKRTLSGGIFLEHAVHFFDLIRSWLGEGEVLTAWQAARPETSQVDQVGCETRHGEALVSHYHGFHQSSPLESQTVRLVFEQGDVLLEGWVHRRMQLRCLTDDAGVAALREILPPDTSYTYGHVGDGRTSRRGGRREAPLCVQAAWSAEVDAQALYGRALRALMMDFLRWTDHDESPPRVTGEDGLEAVRLAEAAQRRAEETPWASVSRRGLAATA